jgi:hypothetical protein
MPPWHLVITRSRSCNPLWNYIYFLEHFSPFFQGLPMIALQCLCDLLKSVPHFNFRTNIMAVLVPKMNDDSTDNQVSWFNRNNVNEQGLVVRGPLRKEIAQFKFQYVRGCLELLLIMNVDFEFRHAGFLTSGRNSVYHLKTRRLWVSGLWLYLRNGRMYQGPSVSRHCWSSRWKRRNMASCCRLSINKWPNLSHTRKWNVK